MCFSKKTKMRHRPLIVSISYLLVVDSVCGHSVFLSGICNSVMPSSDHYHLANYSKSSFYLIQSSNYFEHDRPILVELGGSTFRGFLLVAVDPLSGARIGKWMETRGTYVLSCSAIIHSDERVKKHALLVWQPPSNSKGYVAFEATIMDTDNCIFAGQVSILPHQLYTHYQMSSIYEPNSPALVTNKPMLNLGWTTPLRQQTLHSLVTVRRDHTLADILATQKTQSSVNGRAMLDTTSGEMGDKKADSEASAQPQVTTCDQQARVPVLS